MVNWNTKKQIQIVKASATYELVALSHILDLTVKVKDVVTDIFDCHVDINVFSDNQAVRGEEEGIIKVIYLLTFEWLGKIIHTCLVKGMLVSMFHLEPIEY